MHRMPCSSSPPHAAPAAHDPPSSQQRAACSTRQRHARCSNTLPGCCKCSTGRHPRSWECRQESCPSSGSSLPAFQPLLVPPPHCVADSSACQASQAAAVLSSCLAPPLPARQALRFTERAPSYGTTPSPITPSLPTFERLDYGCKGAGEAELQGTAIAAVASVLWSVSRFCPPPILRSTNTCSSNQHNVPRKHQPRHTGPNQTRSRRARGFTPLCPHTGRLQVAVCSPRTATPPHEPPVAVAICPPRDLPATFAPSMSHQNARCGGQLPPWRRFETAPPPCCSFI
jgi:hypothetical protein